MPDDRYADAMRHAERVLGTVAARADQALTTMARRTPEAKAAAKRERQRRKREAAKRFKRILLALAVILAAFIAAGTAFGPPGAFGAFLLMLAMVAAIVILSIYPKTRRGPQPVEQLSNAEVVHRLDALLVRERPALPPRALAQVDAISAQLPLLEKRLETLSGLDPLAQDARRLMGQHLPDLIERYERVPPTMRAERDAEGYSVEDRLLRGLGAARQAVDDIGRKLSAGDVSAFETQGRFIESRYKDGELG